MLNEVRIPSGGITPLATTWEAATKKAISGVLPRVRAMAELQNNSYQHRHCSNKADGAANHRYINICTGGNPAYRADHSKARMDGGVFAFVYPGEPNPLNTGPAPNWRADYIYDDSDKNSLGHQWLRFLLDTKNSPWRHVLRNVVELDPDVAYAQRAIMFQHFDNIPFWVHQLMLMAGRWMIEGPRKLALWSELVEDGIRPQSAYIASTQFIKPRLTDPRQGEYTVTYAGQHEAIGALASTAHHLRDGLYTVTNPAWAHGGQQVPGPYKGPDRKMSAGFCGPTKGAVADTLGKKIEANLSTLQVAARKVGGINYKSILDFAGMIDAEPDLPTVKTEAKELPPRKVTGADYDAQIEQERLFDIRVEVGWDHDAPRNALFD